MRTVTSYQYEQTKLKALFDLICDKENWKNPIHCMIPLGSLQSFSEACVHFTGAPLSLIEARSLKNVQPEDYVECECPGYYNTVGA